MPASAFHPLQRTSNILFILIALTAILYFAEPLLAPMVFALVLAMLLAPLSKKLENWGINRGLAAVICILALILTFTVIIGLLSWQMSTIARDLDQIKSRLGEVTGQIQAYISSHTGIKLKQQQAMIKNADTGSPLGMLAQTTGNFLGFLVNVILVLVYIFLILYYRDHLMKFIQKAVPASEKGNVAGLVHQASHVSQQYLGGLAMMIAALWVMYGIGFSIVGVKYAIFFAILCGTLEIIPFIGNITGTTLTVTMGIVQGGDLKLVAGILITYGLVQFIQSYILQPLIVGKQVDLNPLFTIVSIIIGDAVWGVPGMILAVPVFGMLKIVCDHFEPLKPYGFLLGGSEKDKKPGGLMDRIKKIFK
ncbi:AI-2E family transporter [Mucilaginibacter corticis]|uniref:AI-2E family transporter n=1 Tax=Mucilaginibacter corticis TaxID=2597670 RepID=A0A556MXG4_9SPHI|nr:AI-2E family transporter [Mucilaginibacter corticis]TSJ44489.1 AI-2E family transporter [Mucilaginibacter corticis]